MPTAGMASTKPWSDHPEGCDGVVARNEILIFHQPFEKGNDFGSGISEFFSNELTEPYFVGP